MAEPRPFLKDPLGAVGHGIADVTHKISEALHLDAIPHGHGVFHEHTPQSATAEPDTIKPPAEAASAGEPAPVSAKKEEPRGDAVEAVWKAATTPHAHGIFHEEQKPEPKGDAIEALLKAASTPHAHGIFHEEQKPEPKGDAIEALWKAASTPHGHGLFHEEQKPSPKGDSIEALGRGISGTFNKVLHHEKSAPDAHAATPPPETPVS